jgi:hypothetical protein
VLKTKEEARAVFLTDEYASSDMLDGINVLV